MTEGEELPDAYDDEVTQATKTMRKELVDEVKEEELRQILDAQNIDPDAAKTIRHHLECGTAKGWEIAQLQRYNVLKFMRMGPGELTQEFLEKRWKQGKLRSQVQYLEMFLCEDRELLDKDALDLAFNDGPILPHHAWRHEHNTMLKQVFSLYGFPVFIAKHINKRRGCGIR